MFLSRLNICFDKDRMLDDKSSFSFGVRERMSNVGYYLHMKEFRNPPASSRIVDS